MNILLVSPATPDTFWGFRHALPLLRRKAAFPPLGLLTVAAMLPVQWRLKLVDLDVTPLRDEDIDWADWIMLSGMIIHEESCRCVAKRCRARNKPVLAGGPLFTTGHDQFPEIPHFVLGEAEGVIDTLVADLTSGLVREHYAAPGWPDITGVPVPRWDLIRLKDYVMVPVQFSRGCPFDCEFCDIPVMYGRTPRVKTPEQLVRELDALIDIGWRESIFIVDDNFIGHKTRAKELLRAIIDWRHRRAVSCPFVTEASINMVDDKELLGLMVEAGFKKVFIGLETPDTESLTECGKVQNVGRDLRAAVRTLQHAGFEVMGGFIVGFDHDQENIFERQLAFIQETGIATAMVGLLNALPKTRLFTRLTLEGRIVRRSTGNNLDAVLNFVPRLERETLLQGYRSLVQTLYSPKSYYGRIEQFLREYRPQGPRTRPTCGDVAAFIRAVWVLGIRTRGRLAYWCFLMRLLTFHRRAFAEAMGLAILGHHFRRVADSL